MFLLQGAAINHKQAVSAKRTAIRNEINKQLRKSQIWPDLKSFSPNSIGTAAKDDSAQMEWKHYWRKVVARHKVMIEGWPGSIPFKNLSEASSSLPELKMLLERWEDGRTCWKRLSDGEAERVVEERKAQGEVSDGVRQTRSDRGKKRKRPSNSMADDFLDEDEDGDDQMEQRKSRKIRKRRKVTSAEAISSDEFSGNDD